MPFSQQVLSVGGRRVLSDDDTLSSVDAEHTIQVGLRIVGGSPIAEWFAENGVNVNKKVKQITPNGHTLCGAYQDDRGG